MKIAFLKVTLKTAFTENQLVKGGWLAKDPGKLYTRSKGIYRFDYIVKTFGKIKVSELHAVLDSEDTTFNYNNLSEFTFEDCWSILWNKSYTPNSVEIIMRKNLFDYLINLGWKPSVLGVIDYLQEDNELSYYYPAPEGEELYKLVDDNPCDVLNYISKLRALNII